MALPLIPILIAAVAVVAATRKKPAVAPQPPQLPSGSGMPPMTTQPGTVSPPITAPGYPGGGGIPGSDGTMPGLPGGLLGGLPGGLPTVPSGVALPGGIAWPYSAGGVASCPPGPVNDVPIASLPSPARESIQFAMATATDPNALEAVANQLSFCGYSVAGAEVRARVNVLRGGTNTGGGGPLPGDTTLPEGTPVPSTAGEFASPVTTKWTKTVLTDAQVATDPSYRKFGITTDNPINMTKSVFGADGENARTPSGLALVTADGVTAPFTGVRRWVELVIYNAKSDGSNTVGNPAEPYGAADGSTPPFNLVNYVPGQLIRIPPSWNAYISQNGVKAGSTTPFPAAPPAVAGYGYGYGYSPRTPSYGGRMY